MYFLNVTLTRYVSDDFPGFVKCLLTDLHNQQWTFIEKVPVVTTENISVDTVFPVSGVIAVEIIKHWEHHGKSVMTVSTAKPWDIESVDGQTMFDVFSDQIIQEIS